MEKTAIKEQNEKDTIGIGLMALMGSACPRNLRH
jgi:hypothetical protein